MRNWRFLLWAGMVLMLGIGVIASLRFDAAFAAPQAGVPPTQGAPGAVTANQANTGPLGGCVTTTYNSADVPRSIGPDLGTVTTSTLTIADNINISTIEVVGLVISHTYPPDLDVYLIHPSGVISVELFTDVCAG